MKLEALPRELRPTRALMKHRLLASLLAGPFFFFPALLLFARYRSLRYTVDEKGISMRWGILFRREVSLNYARIPDGGRVSFRRRPGRAPRPPRPPIPPRSPGRSGRWPPSSGR